MLFRSFLLVALAGVHVFAAPTHPRVVSRDGSDVTPVPASVVDSLTPYTHFARAGYCRAAQTSTWTCGDPCNSLPGFQVTAAGGNAQNAPSWFVGYYPSLNSVVVSHQGTNSSDIVSIANNINVVRSPLSANLFPGLGSGPKVHSGFLAAHATSAGQILAAVRKTMTDKGTNKITLTGHSLGGALSIIDSVFLALNIPEASIKTVVYSTPRVGNQEFADLVDQKITDLTRINNKLDIVPIIPGRFLGYGHPSGELYITPSGTWISCPGQDNTNPQCSIETVKNILNGNTEDHRGPFNGLSIGSSQCAP